MFFKNDTADLVNRHTGGLEKHSDFTGRKHCVNRHTGGLENETARTMQPVRG